jgi:hypothetical protein
VGSRHQRREEGNAGTLSGWRAAGPRAESGAGLNGLPRPFILFFISFSFSFSDF